MKYYLTAIIFIVIVYLGMAFIVYDINPSNWHQFARFVFIANHY